MRFAAAVEKPDSGETLIFTAVYFHRSGGGPLSAPSALSLTKRLHQLPSGSILVLLVRSGQENLLRKSIMYQQTANANQRIFP
jgi:hypothetical protein